jgi:aminobenzoyl-glutamate transport protein
MIANMVRNFINFPPLGVVLVSMFGIGVAERVGLFGAFLKWMATLVPNQFLTPMVVFLGIMSNTASDAGYIILPPLAAGLYAAFGRSPIVGIAAAFAGVSGGFSANLLIASTDTLVAPLTEGGARVLDPNYTVLATCNWYFLAGSTFMLTLLGWFVTAKIVEPRLSGPEHLAGVTADANARTLDAAEARGLRYAGIGLLASLLVVAAAIAIPGAPLNGPMPAPAPTYGRVPSEAEPARGQFRPVQEGAKLPASGQVTIAKGLTIEAETTDADGKKMRGTAKTNEAAVAQARMEPAPVAQPRWSQAIVPIIFFCFLVPGLAYGISTGAVRSQKDVAKAFIHSMQSMAPIIAMAFFASQFLGCLSHSQLDRMIAFAGGKFLVSLGLPRAVLLAAMILLVMIVNILMSSMSAKWTALSVILVPMMMMAGLSPELTQAAYRVGDSVTNIVTPLNSYIIVILAAVQRWKPDMGIGNLIAMMVPYSVIFAVVWIIFLLAWLYLGIPLGPGAPSTYVPQAAH